MWLITMILLTPLARRASISRWAAAVSSSKVVSASGLDDALVLSAMVRPMMPMDWPSRFTMMDLFTSPVVLAEARAELAPKVTLALSTGVLQLPLCSRSMNFFRPLSPLSNSWLPRVKASKQTVFIIAASASPSAPARLKYSVPVWASPACSLSTFLDDAARLSIAAVTRGKPAESTATALAAAPVAVLSCSVLLLLSRLEWWSLMCRMVRSIGCGPSPPPQAASRAVVAARTRLVVVRAVIVLTGLLLMACKERHGGSLL